MAKHARLYTPAEASAVCGLKVTAVNDLIDKHIVDVARPTDGGRAPRRCLTHAHLLCMRLEYFLAGCLPVERRQWLFVQVASKPSAKTIKVNSVLYVNVAKVRKYVEERCADLEVAESAISIDPENMSGEPLIKGTQIPVYAVAALLKHGATHKDIRKKYPGGDRRRVELARLWAAAHPRRGRPKRLPAGGEEQSGLNRP